MSLYLKEESNTLDQEQLEKVPNIMNENLPEVDRSCIKYRILFI